MSDDKKPFTVSDRRHFTAEGEAREASIETRVVEPDRPQREPTRREASGGETTAPEGGPLAHLVVSLAAQASMMLGVEGGEEAAGPDLQAARSVIDILEMLQEKTAGRRTPTEDQILERVLFELRLAYVAQSRTGGA